MAWNCFILTSREAHAFAPGKGPAIGAMWYAEQSEQSHLFKEGNQGTDYKQNHSRYRPPIVVMTPAGPWCVDAKGSDGGEGWQVIGDAPHITVTPSINFVGYYHGWLTGGILSDDIEGRLY